MRNSVTVFYLKTLPFAISSCRLRGSLLALFSPDDYWKASSLSAVRWECIRQRERERDNTTVHAVFSSGGSVRDGEG